MFQLKFGNKKLGEVNENRVKWKNLQKEEIYAAGNILFGVKFCILFGVFRSEEKWILKWITLSLSTSDPKLNTKQRILPVTMWQHK